MYEVVLVESRVTVVMSSSLKNGASSHIEMLSAYTPFYIGIRNLRFKGRTVGPVDQLKHMCIPTCRTSLEPYSIQRPIKADPVSGETHMASQHA